VIAFDLLLFILHEYGQANRQANTPGGNILNFYLDEIFDRISSYFPINFVPPKNDKFQIAPSLLKEKLSKCFISTSVLAKLAFPFILDKIRAP